MTCAGYCSADDNCKSVFVDESGVCKPVGHREKLVRASRKNKKAIQVWSKKEENPISTKLLTPHFMILGREIEDYSLDGKKSPPLTYRQVLSGYYYRPYVFDEQQMKLNIIKEQKSRTLGISLEYSPIEEVKENLE